MIHPRTSSLQYRATRELAALHQLGNSAWDVLFGRVMPQVGRCSAPLLLKFMLFTSQGHLLVLAGLGAICPLESTG